VRDGFLLDPDVVYLNHGGYGACPIAVFDDYQRWQRELERQPTDFFARRLSTWFWEGRTGPSLLDDARSALAAFVGAWAETSFERMSCTASPRSWSGTSAFAHVRSSSHT